MPRQPNPALTETLKNIQDGIDDMVVRIPEQEFVQQYLPILTGNGPRTASGGFNLTPWIERVGGITRSAHVVNQNNEILWTIPPMQPNASLSTSENHSFLNTISEARQTAISNPNAYNQAASRSYGNGTITVSSQTTQQVKSGTSC